jgi:hypothetical protein
MAEEINEDLKTAKQVKEGPSFVEFPPRIDSGTSQKIEIKGREWLIVSVV